MLTNEQRTQWIQSQAISDEKPTGSQTGTILRGSKSLVYLYVTGTGLARPFRVFFTDQSFPHYVVLSVFDEQFSDFNMTLIHWTKALHEIRVTNAKHKVERVLWNDSMRDGSTFIKWTRNVREDRYTLEGIMGGAIVFHELPVVPEVL